MYVAKEECGFVCEISVRGEERILIGKAGSNIDLETALLYAIADVLGALRRLRKDQREEAKKAAE